MNGYELWEQTKNDMRYEDKDVVVLLEVYPEMETTDITKVFHKPTQKDTFNFTISSSE